MPAQTKTAYRPSKSVELVVAKTGRTWDDWFQRLDRWGAAEKGHTATAAWLVEAHGVAGWWAQTVTVEYERARGLREVGQRLSGEYEVTATRTVDAPIAVLKAAWLDAKVRAKWLKDPNLRAPVSAGMRAARQSETRMAHMVRLELRTKGAKTPHRLELAFATKPNGKAAVSLAHTKVPERKERDHLKAAWKEALDAMKAHLENAR